MRANFPAPIAIEWMLTASIVAALRQPKRHAAGKIKKLARSISETGYFNPMVIDEYHQIIAGHARLSAAKHLGMLKVPVIVLSGLSQAQKQALALADNKLGDLAKWDMEDLALELSDILDAGIDLDLTAFDAIELDRILTPSQAENIAEEDELPPLPANPVSRLGDHWILGDEHELVCGDARDPSTYQHLMFGQRVGLVVTDPPYNVPIPGHVSGKGTVQHSNFVMASGEMSTTEFSNFLKTVMRLGRDHSREGSLHYYCIDWRHVADMVISGREIFSLLLNICVWAKSNGGMGSFYRSQHEMVAVFKHGDAPHINNVQLGRKGRYRSNLWQYPGGSSFSASRKSDLADHPTVKPIAMIADLIRDATKPGDLVLDPFGGSGTTLLAAEETGRRARLIEIDPRYVDVIVRRFEERTGKKAQLRSSGKTFAEVRAERQEIADV